MTNKELRFRDFHWHVNMVIPLTKKYHIVLETRNVPNGINTRQMPFVT